MFFYLLFVGLVGYAIFAFVGGYSSRVLVDGSKVVTDFELGQTTLDYPAFDITNRLRLIFFHADGTGDMMGPSPIQAVRVRDNTQLDTDRESVIAPDDVPLVRSVYGSKPISIGTQYLTRRQMVTGQDESQAFIIKLDEAVTDAGTLSKPINAAAAQEKATTTKFHPHQIEAFVAIPREVQTTMKPFAFQPFLVNNGEMKYVTVASGDTDLGTSLGVTVDPADVTAALSSITSTALWPFTDPAPNPASLLIDPMSMLQLTKGFTTCPDAILPVKLDKTQAASLAAKYPEVSKSKFTARYYTKATSDGTNIMKMFTHYSQQDMDDFLGTAFNFGVDGMKQTAKTPFNEWILGINYVNHILAVPGAAVCDSQPLYKALWVNVPSIDNETTTITVNCTTEAMDTEDNLDALCAALNGVVDTSEPKLLYLRNSETELAGLKSATKDGNDIFTLTITRGEPAFDHTISAPPLAAEDYPDTPPEGWTCPIAFWKDNMCDCNCGVMDPDCIDPVFVFGCSDEDAKCSTVSTCLSASVDPADVMFITACDTATVGTGTVRQQFTGTDALLDTIIASQGPDDADIMESSVCPEDYLTSYQPSISPDGVPQCNVPLKAKVFASHQNSTEPLEMDSPDMDCFNLDNSMDRRKYRVSARVQPSDRPFNASAVDDSVAAAAGFGPGDISYNPLAQINRDAPSTTMNVRWGDTNITSTGVNSICLSLPKDKKLFMLHGQLVGDLLPNAVTRALFVSNVTLPVLPGAAGFPTPSEWYDLQLTSADGEKYTVLMSFVGTGAELPDGKFGLAVDIQGVTERLTTPYYEALENIASDGIGGMSTNTPGDIYLTPPTPKDWTQAQLWQSEDISSVVAHVAGDGRIQVLSLAPPAAWTAADAAYFKLACQCYPHGDILHPGCATPHVVSPYFIDLDDGSGLRENPSVSIQTPQDGANACKRLGVDSWDVYTSTLDQAGLTEMAKRPTYQLTELGASGDYRLVTDVPEGTKLFAYRDGAVKTRFAADMFITLTAAVDAPVSSPDARWSVEPAMPEQFTADYLMYTIPDLAELNHTLLAPTLDTGTMRGESVLRRKDSIAEEFMETYTEAEDDEAIDDGLLCQTGDDVNVDRFSDRGVSWLASTGSASFLHTLPLTNRGGDIPEGYKTEKNRISRTYIFTYPLTNADIARERAFYAANPDGKWIRDGLGGTISAKYTLSEKILGRAKRPCPATWYDTAAQTMGSTGPMMLAEPAPGAFPQLSIETFLMANEDATLALLDEVVGPSIGNPAGWGRSGIPGMSFIQQNVPLVRKIMAYTAMDKMISHTPVRFQYDLDAVLGSTENAKVALYPGQEVVLTAKVEIIPYYTRGVLGGVDIDHWTPAVTTSVSTNKLLDENAHQSRVTFVVELSDEVNQVFLQSSETFAKLFASFGGAFALTGFGLTVLDIYYTVKDSTWDVVIKSLKDKRQKKKDAKKARDRDDDEEEDLEDPASDYPVLAMQGEETEETAYSSVSD